MPRSTSPAIRSLCGRAPSVDSISPFFCTIPVVSFCALSLFAGNGIISLPSQDNICKSTSFFLFWTFCPKYRGHCMSKKKRGHFSPLRNGRSYYGWESNLIRRVLPHSVRIHQLSSDLQTRQGRGCPPPSSTVLHRTERRRNIPIFCGYLSAAICESPLQKTAPNPVPLPATSWALYPHFA